MARQPVLADRAGRQPPARLCPADRGGGGIARRGGREQPEARRAAARHPRQRAAFLRRELRQHVANLRQEAHRRRLEVVGAGASQATKRIAASRGGGQGRSAWPRTRSRRAEHGRGRERQAGIDQQTASGGRPSQGSTRSPVPRMRAVRPARQTGTSAPSPAAKPGQIGWRHAQAPQAVQAAQHRRGIGRAAAQARRHRQALLQRDPHRRIAPGAGGETPRRAQHQIVGLGRERARERPVSSSSRRSCSASTRRSPNAANAVRLSSS